MALAKIFAQFAGKDGRILKNDMEISSEAEAIAYGVKAGAWSFQTYENDTAERSAFRHLNVDHVFTRDEVILIVKADQSFAAALRKLDIPEEKISSMISRAVASFARQPAEAVYMTRDGQPGVYSQIGRDEKAFDRAGRQIFPRSGPVPQQRPMPPLPSAKPS